MYCPNCGKQLPSDARFCGNCGKGLSGSHNAQASQGGSSVVAKKKASPIPFIAAICVIAVIAIIAVVMFLPRSATSTTSVKLAELGASDPNMSQVLAAYDKDQDQVLSTEELGAITDIAVDGAQELGALESMPNLESIVLTNCKSESVSVTCCKKLKRFTCTNSSAVKKIVLGDKPELSSLCVEGTSVSEVDVSKATSLMEVALDNEIAVKGFNSNTLEEAWIATSFTVSGDLKPNSLPGTGTEKATQTLNAQGKIASATHETDYVLEGGTPTHTSNEIAVTYANDGTLKTISDSYNGGGGSEYSKTVTTETFTTESGRITAISREVAYPSKPSSNYSFTETLSYDANGRYAKLVEVGKSYTANTDVTYASDGSISTKTTSSTYALPLEQWTLNAKGQLDMYTQPARYTHQAGEYTADKLTYDSAGRVTHTDGSAYYSSESLTDSRTQPYGTYTVDYEYDKAGHITSAKSSTGSSAKVTCDDAGNVTHLELTIGSYYSSASEGISITVDATYARVFVPKGTQAPSLLKAPTPTYSYDLFTWPAVRTVTSQLTSFGPDFRGTPSWNQFSAIGSTASQEVATSGNTDEKEQPASSVDTATAAKKAEFVARLEELNNRPDVTGSMTMAEMAQHAANYFSEYKALLQDVLDYGRTLTSNTQLQAAIDGQSQWESDRDSALLAAGQDFPSAYSATVERCSVGIPLTENRIRDLLALM